MVARKVVEECLVEMCEMGKAQTVLADAFLRSWRFRSSGRGGVRSRVSPVRLRFVSRSNIWLYMQIYVCERVKGEAVGRGKARKAGSDQ